ncbi:MAG: orotate phosphoribosyltransferase [Acidobacteria bacterium]|nr:orotate phosphoribosyltransferase [Acidobacteriota bacterium]MYK78345.1 orotate phosphoribosyltransferase [Acidobacteriota bacterium]
MPCRRAGSSPPSSRPRETTPRERRCSHRHRPPSGRNCDRRRRETAGTPGSVSGDPRSALLAILRRESVRFGEFQLAHGGTSNVYVDARLTVMRSDAAALVGRVLLDTMDRSGFRASAVGGMAAGAIPLTTAVVMEAGAAGRQLAGFFVRKEAKDHGRGRRIEGVERPHGAAVILEDTATTGKSTLAAVEAAREAGFEVVGAVALVDRGMGAGPLLTGAGVPYAAAFELDDLTEPAPS